MEESSTIPRIQSLKPAEDYFWLKREGIRHIEKLAGKIWTDYNAPDPGITMLEMMCFALADLGYRCSFPLPDLLAPDPAGPSETNKSFHTAREILPCNPVTLNDFRKLLIDVAGVQNAWLEFKENEKPIHCADEPTIFINCKDEKLSLQSTKKGVLNLKGLYRLEILFEEDINADVVLKNQVKAEVWSRAQAHRDLCEDFCPEIKEIGYEDISICLEIEVLPQANVHAVLAQIWYEVGIFLNPQLHFYTLEELLDGGQSVESIFDGPILDHGFMDEEELEASHRKDRIYASDLYNIIMDIPGVRHIRKLELTNYDAQGQIVSQGQKWQLNLAASDCSVPRIDPARSAVVFYKGELPFITNPEKVESLRTDLEISGKARRPGKKAYDLPIPEGNYRNPGEYHPFTYDLPMVYGVGEAGLPANAPEERIAQARQLKAYLLFFEQILANYFSQLAGIRHLYRWSEAEGNTDFPTYFYQALSNSEIKEVESLYFDSGNLGNRLDELVENPAERLERRNRFLDHLMARFSEQMAEYSLILSSLGGEGATEKLLTDKARFLRDYPELSRDRGKGFDMIATPLWDTENVTGLEKRAGRMLGIADLTRRHLYGLDFSVYEDTNTNKWHFTLDFPLEAPNGPTTVLPFLSIAFDTRSEAENGFERVVRNARTSIVWIEGTESGNQYTLSFKYGTPSEVMASFNAMAVPGFAGLEEIKVALMTQIRTIEERCEGMHILEHILLRPRESSWTDDDILLRTCVKCGESGNANQDDSTGAGGCEGYASFPIFQGGKFKFTFNSQNEAGLLVSPGAGFDSETERDAALFSVYEVAQDAGNYHIEQVSQGGAFRFDLMDENETLFAVSKPGADYDAAEISALVQSLLRFFVAIANPNQAIEVNTGVGADPCQYENDPYSFRISVVLPGWTDRFADANFRKFAERVIREETPAHIQAKICWISRFQMKDLENCYRQWLLANAAFLPPTQNSPQVSAKLQDLVGKLAGLKNYYPARSVLHDCAGPGNDNAIILDNSILGNS
jgi:hypothetical protein